MRRQTWVLRRQERGAMISSDSKGVNDMTANEHELLKLIEARKDKAKAIETAVAVIIKYLKENQESASKATRII